MPRAARPELVEGRARGATGSPRAGAPPPRWARLADLLCVLLVALAAIVAMQGGIRTRVAGWRVAITSPYRMLLWAAAAALVRHLAVPRPPIYRDLPVQVADWFPVKPQPLPLGEARLVDESGSTAWRRIAEWTTVFVGFALLVAAFTWPQVRRLDSVPDLGDPLFSIWRISWINHQLFRSPSGLFDANIFYPARLTLAYSDSVVVPGVLGAPLFWLGLHPVLIYNLLFLSGFVLSGVTMYLLVRALTGRRDAAAVAGIVFTLHPYRLEHFSHLELQMTMWMPLALWGLHRTMARATLRDALVTGTAFALQMLSSLYYGVFFTAYAVVVGATLWIGRRFPLRPIAMLAAGGALAGVLIAPVASQHVASKPVVGDRSLAEVKDFSAEGREYLKPHARNRVYKQWAFNAKQERQLFPRITPVLLALVGAWPPMSVATIAYTTAFALTFDASLGSNGVAFLWLRNHLPGYPAVRVPARFSILGGMTLAILAGYGAARLLARWPRRRAVVMLAIVAPIFFEALPNISLVRVWPEPPAIYARFAGQPPTVIAEFPTPAQTGLDWSDTRYLYFSTFHWQRLVNGASGFQPQSYWDFYEHTEDFPSDSSLAYLRARGVQYIGWHGAFTNPARYQHTAELLEARSDVELVAVAPWEGSESRLYRLR